MSVAMVAALSWPTIVIIVLFIQFLIIWRLRVRVRTLEGYERWYLDQRQHYQSSTQPLVARRPLARPNDF
jgi:hypothetical protein